MRLKEIRLARGKTQQQLADEIGLEGTVLSRIENYVCLPTPEKLDAMCKALDCAKQDIYERKEIDLVGGEKGAQKGTSASEAKVYRLTVSLDRKVLQVLNQYTLNELGYANISDFVRKSVDRLIRRYEKRVAARKSQSNPK